MGWDPARGGATASGTMKNRGYAGASSSRSNVSNILNNVLGGGRPGLVRAGGGPANRNGVFGPVGGGNQVQGGGGGAIQNGGGAGGPGVSGNYNAKTNPLYQQMLDMLKNQMNTAQGLYDKAPDFSGQRANINKMQSIANRERAQQAAARGGSGMGMGQTTAQIQQTNMGDNQAMTGAAREWGNESLKHQENVLNSMNNLASIMSGTTGGAVNNEMAQLAEQRAQNALGLEAWRAQEGLKLQQQQVANSGQIGMLNALYPWMNNSQQGRANPLNLI